MVAAFGLLLWLERRRSLRNTVESKERRVARNIGVAGVSAALLHFAERPVSVPLARLVERRRLGLLQRLSLPRWLETLLGVALLDYTLYLWHVLEHRVPALWRFHAVHHVDLDLDASTALRFHFGELAASIPWRAAQIVVIGVTPRTLALYQGLLMLSVMFHHSNVRISTRTEKWLSRIIMTPRLHGIHHSVEHDDLNSNWSSGLTIWDTIHHTLRAHGTGDEVTIGLSSYRDPDELTLPRILTMPFAQSTAERVTQRGVRNS
ncbi:MAG TPA: sterol desaturase family protein [Gemmatimonadaceae bacterium]|nr:sterol desaturase family protein [Gemmatimonadaceae bacterium]